MKKSEFKELFMNKTGLTSQEYDQLFDALAKYDMHDEAIADALSDNAFAVSASLPNTAKTHFEPTKQDKELAEKLGIEPMAVAKFTTWCEEYGSGNFDSSWGGSLENGSVRAAFNKIDIDQYSGQHYTVEDVAGSLSVYLDRKAEAIKDEKAEQLKEKIEEITEKIRESLNPSTYEDEERHLKLVADGDKITIYSTDNHGFGWNGSMWNGDSESVICIIDCPAEYRKEFFSEFKEQIEDAKIHNDFIETDIRKLANNIVKEIKEENEFSTGSPTIDANRDALKAEIAKLERKLEEIQEKFNPFSNDFIGQNFGTNIEEFIAETQQKLDSYYKQLEIYEGLEVSTASAMKTSLQTARERIIESINELKGDQKIENLPEETREHIERLQSELDEINDRINAAKRKIASAGIDLEEDKKGHSIKEKSQGSQKLPFIIGESEGTIEKLPYYPDKDNGEITLLVDKVKDTAATIVAETAPFIRGAIQKLVVNVDNAVNDLKEDFENISTNNAGIKDFINSVKEFAENTTEKLREIVIDSKNIAAEATQEVNSNLDSVKQTIQDVEEAVNGKSSLLLDKETIDVELFDE